MTQFRPKLTSLRPRAPGLSDSLNSRKEKTMFSFKAHKLTRRLLILGILLGCLVFLALPPGMRAQDECYTTCDSTYNSGVTDCRIDYAVCEILGLYPQSYCESQFGTCWFNASNSYSSCVTHCGYDSIPGRGSGGDPAFRNSCVRSCDDVYWTCFDNGGAATGTYQSCIASGGTLDDCCFAERSICLTGCQ